MGRLRRVLHPTDFSRASRAAFERAVETAKANRGELVLLNVIAPTVLPIGDGYVSPKVYAEMEASARAYAQRELSGSHRAGPEGGRPRHRDAHGGHGPRADRAGRPSQAEPTSS